MNAPSDPGVVDAAGLSSVQVRRRLRTDPAPVVFLVLGATEAHGPHLPLLTDTVIGAHLARVAGQRLVRETGVPGLLPPVFATTAASCAAGFAGTVSVPPAVEQAALTATMKAWLDAGATRLCLVTLHFDPDHLGAVHDALETLSPQQREQVVFPDFTRREHAKRIGGEFATGDCHAGQFETSLMLVAAPEVVDPIYNRLPEKKVGLVKGIREGKRSFRELGMSEGYCGDPARASSTEGGRLFGVLAEIVVEACRDRWSLDPK